MADLPPVGDNRPPSPEPGLALPPPADGAPADGAPAKPTGHTRISGVWFGVIIAAIVLTLLLVFILQNTKSVKISFFTTGGSMPLGVALLLAAIGGVFLAAVAGSLRILQLRRRLSGATGPARGGRRQHRGQVGPEQPAPQLARSHLGRSCPSRRCPAQVFAASCSPKGASPPQPYSSGKAAGSAVPELQEGAPRWGPPLGRRRDATTLDCSVQLGPVAAVNLAC